MQLDNGNLTDISLTISWFAAEDTTSDATSAPSNPITEDGAGGKEMIPAVPKKAGRLREYIEKFDQTTLLEMSRMLSTESVAIVETQTSALFGDIRKLQEQMQNAVGQDVSSYEELMNRVQVNLERPVLHLNNSQNLSNHMWICCPFVMVILNVRNDVY